MANICEVCGRIDGEEIHGTEMSLDTLHVCEQCRKDRQQETARESS